MNENMTNVMTADELGYSEIGERAAKHPSFDNVVNLMDDGFFKDGSNVAVRRCSFDQAVLDAVSSRVSLTLGQQCGGEVYRRCSKIADRLLGWIFFAWCVLRDGFNWCLTLTVVTAVADYVATGGFIGVGGMLLTFFGLGVVKSAFAVVWNMRPVAKPIETERGRFFCDFGWNWRTNWLLRLNGRKFNVRRFGTPDAGEGTELFGHAMEKIADFTVSWITRGSIAKANGCVPSSDAEKNAVEECYKRGLFF